MFGLSAMTSLILDNNKITSHTVFPPLPKLQILYVNKNNISNLSVFMESVATNFPELKQLCMMNNPAAPSYFNGGSKQEYLDYRYVCITFNVKPDLLLLRKRILVWWDCLGLAYCLLFATYLLRCFVV